MNGFGWNENGEDKTEKKKKDTIEENVIMESQFFAITSTLAHILCAFVFALFLYGMALATYRYAIGVQRVFLPSANGQSTQSITYLMQIEGTQELKNSQKARDR